MSRKQAVFKAERRMMKGKWEKVRQKGRKMKAERLVFEGENGGKSGVCNKTGRL